MHGGARESRTKWRCRCRGARRPVLRYLAGEAWRVRAQHAAGEAIRRREAARRCVGAALWARPPMQRRRHVCGIPQRRERGGDERERGHGGEVSVDM